ncbi:hypothetical protein GCM10010357_05530 [Streptomyces luteireticuli]|uniref:Uncharacterized protein n=1 Tax=Streptomyces luteireticuli TaxID=173858 RepID=A0ABP3I1N8_9ACTN
MTSSSNPGGVRATLREFLKRDLPDQPGLSWLCEVHKDPEAMQQHLRFQWVCTKCTREAARPQ